MKEPFKFNPSSALETINDCTELWRSGNNLPTKWVIGISGGKDSTVAAGMLSKQYGQENVLGVLMPCGEQPDIQDSYDVVKTLGIKSIEVNIRSAINSLNIQILNYSAVKTTPADLEVADTNLPPRIRMATLYYVAQAVGGIVVNTSNLSESILGYGTLYGDIAGSFAPLRGLTATEVVLLGHELGLPAHLVNKTPADGLSGKTDEDNLGVKYIDVDRYIRYGATAVSEEVVKLVNEKYRKNKFKSDIVDIPGVLFEDYPNYVTNPQ